MPDDRSWAALDRQRIHGSHPIPADCSQSRGNDRYSPPRNPARPRLPATRSLSPRFHQQPSQWPGGKQALYYQGAPRSHGERPLSYEQLQFSYADAYQHRPQSGPHDASRSRDPLPLPVDPSRARDPLYHTGQYTERCHQAWQSYASLGTAYTSPWASYGHHSARLGPAWYQPGQPSPGHHWGTRQQWDYASSWFNWHGSSPQAQALVWEHSDSSSVEANPRDRTPRSRSKSKQRRREASGSSSKKQKTASSDRHRPATPSSSSSLDSEEAESQSAPSPEEASDSRYDDSAAQPQGAPDSHEDNQDAPAAGAGPHTSTEATPLLPGDRRAPGPPPQETMKEDAPRVSTQSTKKETTPLPLSST